MNKGKWAIAAALAVGILSVPANATPVVGAGAGGVKAALAEQSNVERVDWVRRCFRDRFGDRHCRRVWVGPSVGPGYYYGRGRRHHHYYGGGHRHHGGVHHYRGGRGHIGGRGHMGGHGGRR